MEENISVTVAQNCIIDSVVECTSRIIPLNQASGKILAEDIIAQIDYPPFDQSAMDGYAVRFSGSRKDDFFKLNGVVSAGDAKKVNMGKGHAVRIFTGAKIPAGSDAVVIQEEARENDLKVFVTILPEQGAHIRRKGEVIRSGKIAIKKGALLHAGAIGYLASLGVNKVRVIQNPQVILIATGSEIQMPGRILKKGNIYESNSACLASALMELGICAKKTIVIPDDRKIILRNIRNALNDCDVLITTGGIGGGDFDFLRTIFNESGVKGIFYRVRQKPGKPFYFGKKKNTLVFGLPGNPVSSLTCFYEYVYPAIKRMQGHTGHFLKKGFLALGTNQIKNKNLTLFLRGKAYSDYVIPCRGQKSHNMKSFAEANCLVYIPEGDEEIKANSMVEVHYLPD